MTTPDNANLLANDRPTSLDDDLYQWAIDAEEMLRSQADRIASLEAELEHANQWRDLALQFDGHRMQALGYLKALLRGEKDLETGARNFIASPPLSGEAVLAERLTQLSQAQAVPTERLHNACAYALEWLNECDGNLAHNVVDVLEQALAASPTPPVRKGLSDEQIEAAAQKLAICMDYPWEFMPDKGKKRMRFDALCIIEAAHGIQGEGNAD